MMPDDRATAIIVIQTSEKCNRLQLIGGVKPRSARIGRKVTISPGLRSISVLAHNLLSTKSLTIMNNVGSQVLDTWRY